VGAFEAIEQSWYEFRGDSGPVIADAQPDCAWQFVCGHGHGAVAVLDRVGEQVGQDLAEV